MKYIRTKDGIYKNKDLIGVQYQGKIYYNDEEIIQQADTIEELCDEFVCKLKEIPTTWCSFDLDEIEEGLKTHSLKEWEWFGMIWTDKGLIYVAKMNKEGELELL